MQKKVLAKNKIRIIFITSGLSRGGEERVVVDLINGIDHREFEPVVCSFRGGPLQEEIYKGIRVYANLAHRRHDPALLLRLWKILRSERPEIIDVIGTGDVGIIGRVIPLLEGRPIVIQSLHNTGMLNGNRMVENLNRLLSPITHYYVAVSRSHRDYLVESLKLPRNKILVIYNGVALASKVRSSYRSQIRVDLGFDREDVVVGSVGRFTPIKGHDVLLHAAAQVSRVFPRVKFLLIGGGNGLEAMKQMSNNLELNDCVTFTGERDDVHRLLAAIDIFVSSSYSEGFPVSILEAMAACLPVVATRVGGVPEQVVDGLTGILIPPGSPSILAESIIRLVSQPNLRKQMGIEGRKRAKSNFSLATMIQKRERLFRDLYSRDLADINRMITN